MDNDKDFSPEQILRELRLTFRDEAYELLFELENALLELEKKPDDKELISRAFRAMHTIKGSGGACEFGDVVAFTHELESIFDQVRNGRTAASKELIELALTARDHIRALFDRHYKNGSADDAAGTAVIAALRELTSRRDRFDGEVAYKKLGEILLERGDVSSEDLRQALQAKKRVGEVLVENGAVSPEKVESALAEQLHVRATRERRQGAEALSSIRVSTGKLDSLVNLVGELVTVQARLSRAALLLEHPELLSISEEVERLTASLRENAMNIRMLPIGSTFSKFRRLVHDLSAELGKEIELVTEGAETEIDKTVIERLSEPLVHILRNSIDHGIESPAARIAAGKAGKGTIRLAASHSGTHVLVRVQDDGAGLDTRAICAKAREKGLLRPDAEPGERQVWDLIFTPGFSTAPCVTDLSGRGVGMDVVRRAIDALRGTIELASTPGRGTTVTLRLPLTLAIIDGFLTLVGDSHFIFPLSLVEECVELARDEAAGENGRRLLNVRGRLVPYVRLRDQFMVKGEAPAFEQVVITTVEGKRVGVVVDEVVGEHQTVIKSLGRFYQETKDISGATILGNGTVALLLDIPKLLALVEQQEARQAGGQTASARMSAE